MKLLTRLTSSLLLFAAITVSACFAEGFPGSGSQESWQEASQICAQGMQLVQMQQYGQSIPYFEKAIAVYPFDPLFYYDAGLAHQSFAYLSSSADEKTAHLQKAEAYFLQTCKLKKDVFDVWIHLANVQSELQKYQESLDNLQTALALPDVSAENKQKTLQAMEFVKGKLSGGSAGAPVSSAIPSPSAPVVPPSAVAANSVTSWQTYSNPSASFTMRYPNGWNVSTDPKTGQIDVTSMNGAKLSVLPFSTDKVLDATAAPQVLNAMLKILSPAEVWSKVESAGQNAYRSTFAGDRENAVAALVVSPTSTGTFGRVCIARVPKAAGKIDSATFAEMLGSLHFTGTSNNATGTASVSQPPPQVSSVPQGAPVRFQSATGSDQQESSQSSAGDDGSGGEAAPAVPMQESRESSGSNPAGNDGDENGDEQTVPADTAGSAQTNQQLAMMQQPQSWQHMSQPGSSPTPFNGYTTFVDPSEHAFEVEVPAGWKAEGGLTRGSAIDTRPWVRVTSPDNLITAFIGDGAIPPFSIPTALGNQLGFTVGKRYNGGIVKPYVPASKFVQSYAYDKLKSIISNIQVVEQHEHPDMARSVNGSVGATRSECSSIKITGMYRDIPAVGYFLACTKATVGYGTGVWWVTYIAGELGPADRDAAGLSVILHMMQTFRIDPNWGSQALKTTGEVSRQYTRASQQMSRSISDRYWSQQAFNDRMNQSYWNRQASQDRAANNFSDYIRGTQNVQDPDTGNQYKVNYGPQYHWIDPSGSYVTGTDHSAPGPEWRQLINVP